MRSLPQEVLEIARKLQSHRHKCWVVGGPVRSMILGEEPNDWDLCTTAKPNAVINMFDKVIPTGLQHGTVTVILNGEHFEITTLRSDGDYSDGRRPNNVRFVTNIAEDLARRDFTMNAIAFDPLTNEVVDPFGGTEDILSQVIRAVGDPNERFKEDGLRIMRAARFAATLKFAISSETVSAMATNINSFKKVAQERITSEFIKMMFADKPSHGISIMDISGMLPHVLPELLDGKGMQQNIWHAYDVYRHSLECMDNCPAREHLRIAGLLHDIGKPLTRTFKSEEYGYQFLGHDKVGANLADLILRRLKFSNAAREEIVSLVRNHMICYEKNWSNAAVRRWLRRNNNDVHDLILLARADLKAKGQPNTEKELSDLLDHLVERIKTVSTTVIKGVDLAINGHDVMEIMGIKGGPRVKEALDFCLEYVTDHPNANTKSQLRQLLANRKVDL